ncbi:MAG: protein-S-isoprenylcysteine O-methyltransferase [Candidatus Omnitrophota bacterium]
MNEMVYKIIFVVYALLLALVRLPQHLRYEKKERPRSKVSKSEKWTFPLAFIGMLIIPLIHVSTRWFEPFSMNLPDWARLCGPALGTIGLIYLWRVHIFLGQHWSPISELAHDHKLVAEGPYKYVRHPMYSAFSMIFLGSWLDLSNWLVAIAGLVSWYLFCRVRINMEEKMMLKEFGSEYEEYINRTGSLMPKPPIHI